MTRSIGLVRDEAGMYDSTHCLARRKGSLLRAHEWDWTQEARFLSHQVCSFLVGTRSMGWTTCGGNDKPALMTLKSWQKVVVI
jgi:hypothetical protein